MAANEQKKVDDVSHRIARCLLEPVLRPFLPGTGRRRRTRGRSEDRPAVIGSAADSESPLCKETYPLHGEDHSLVRPYLIAHEQRQAQREEARRQRGRRRALWLAVHGIDIGPRVIHGVEVTA
jgi:hypothetical protein